MTNFATQTVAIFAATLITLISMSAAIAVPQAEAAVVILPVLA
jgi:hypothetical protein